MSRLVFCLSALLFLAQVSSPSARTWYISPGGTGDAPTIQAGIDSAAAGDTVRVLAGEFHENIVVRTPALAIIGSTPDSTVIYPAFADVGPDGPPVFGNSQVMVVAADDVRIENLTIDGDSPTLTPPGVIDARNGIILDYTAGDWNRCRLDGLFIRNMHMSGVCLRGANHASGSRVANSTVVNVKAVPDWRSAGIILQDGTGVIYANKVYDCELGISCLSGSGGHVYNNLVAGTSPSWEEAYLNTGISVQGNTGSLEVGPRNYVFEYEMAGILVDQAAAPVSVHHNLARIMHARDFGSSVGIGIVGQNPLWEGRYEITSNILVGPVSAPGSCGLGIDTYPAGANVVHADVMNNEIHFFDIGIYLVDSSAEPSGVHDVLIGGEELRLNGLSNNEGQSLRLFACHDSIDATWNDWGCYTPSEIETKIYHQVDDPSLGLVAFRPFVGGGTPVAPATWGFVKGIFEAEDVR